MTNVLLLDPINNEEKSNSINFSSSLDHYSFNSFDSHLKDYNKVNKTMKKIVFITGATGVMGQATFLIKIYCFFFFNNSIMSELAS